MSDLKGETAIVTGAAVGLGNAYAVALAKEGVNLAVWISDPKSNRLGTSYRELASLVWHPSAMYQIPNS